MKEKENLLVLLLLLLQEPLQIIKVIVFEVFDDASGCLKTLLDGEAGRLIPEHKTKDKLTIGLQLPRLWHKIKQTNQRETFLRTIRRQTYEGGQDQLMDFQ